MQNHAIVDEDKSVPGIAKTELPEYHSGAKPHLSKRISYVLNMQNRGLEACDN